MQFNVMLRTFVRTCTQQNATAQYREYCLVKAHLNLLTLWCYKNEHYLLTCYLVIARELVPGQQHVHRQETSIQL